VKRGVIYMCWGKKAIDCADDSMKSLWVHAPTMPVLVVGDREAEAHYKGHKLVTFKFLNVDPFQGASFMAGRIKPLLFLLSPFDQSLYVDADTDFEASPDKAFDMLDRWDFIVAETETRSLAASIAGVQETHWTRDWLGTPYILYHNSGMLFWRKNDAVAGLFALWAGEWKRFGDWDEQIALLRALLRSEAVFLTVPFTWNCRYDRAKKAVLLHHRFGTRVAWKFKRSRGVSMTAGEMRQLAEVIRDSMRHPEQVPVMTGAERRTMALTKQEKIAKQAEGVRRLRKPRQAPRDKALPTPPRNMTAREMSNVHA